MEADLGGTEMAEALKFAYALKDEGDRPASILLITDGEVYQHEDIIKKAKSAKHQIFTVGVGSSVAETFIRNIASSTGGAAELVSPNEGMAETIYRQFNRMFQQRASANIQWPNEPKWQSPKSVGNIFAGDTLHVFAGFNHPPIGDACLQLTLDDGRTIDQMVSLQADHSDELSRVAGAHRIENMDSDLEDQATAIALNYQLISNYTNYLIVEDRASEVKPTDLPDVAQVPHMLAAGYGGYGRTARSQILFSQSPVVYASNSRNAQLSSMKMSEIDTYDIPAFLRKQVEEDTSTTPVSISEKSSIFDLIVNTFRAKSQTPIAAIVSIVESDDWYLAYKENVLGLLSSELLDTLETLVKKLGWSDKTVIAALLLAMLKHLDKEIPRHDKRELILALKNENPTQSLINYLEEGLELKNNNWEWKSSCELVPFQ